MKMDLRISILFVYIGQTTCKPFMWSDKTQPDTSAAAWIWLPYRAAALLSQ